MTDNKRYRLHLGITIAVMLFIFIQSAMPGDVSGAESNIIVHFIAGITGWNEEVLSIFVRKAAHFTEFLILGICLCINMYDLMNSRVAKVKPKEAGKSVAKEPCYAAKTPNITAKYIWAAWFIGTVYAMTDEFHQLFVPGRVCSLMDIVIDSAGVACGVLIFLWTQREAVKRKNRFNRKASCY